MTDSFPRLRALTRQFTLGSPSSFQISPDGQRVLYLQTSGPKDPVQRLMQLSVSEGASPEVLVDPAKMHGSDAELPAAERARRERLRESGAGIVAYSGDRALRWAAFALGGELHVVDTTSGDITGIATEGGVVDPRMSPAGEHIAWVSGGDFWVSARDGSGQRRLATAAGSSETWGLANFLAAEEFDRTRGFWWAPDGRSLLVEQVADDNVESWWLGDPTEPRSVPRSIRYPAAGCENPTVRLWHIALDGERTEVSWDRGAWEYLVSVNWTERGPALLTLFDRPQTSAVVMELDASTAALRQVHADDDDAWVSTIPGTPTWSTDGSLITTARRGDQETIAIAGEMIELPAPSQVSALVNVRPDGVVLEVQPSATSLALTFVANDGHIIPITSQEGFHRGAVAGNTVVAVSSELGTLNWSRSVQSWAPGSVATELVSIPSHAMAPPVTLNLQQLTLGPDGLNTVVAWPIDHEPGSRQLPVIMNPYGGPHAQRVIEVGRAFNQAQWLADQGFAVVVADGHGSPGRGPQWERSINNDLASAPLDDQVTVIDALAALFPADIDPNRVGITGWSFGGYLAALAVLRRPDVFRCAVAGAPVTDWRWYDTAYTERYLGDPAAQGQIYEDCSLIPLAATLERPLMIIHGLADDNVFATHSLKLSAALTASGRPHTFVPLPNVSHMTPQVEISENLLRLELEFFRRNL